MKSIPCALVQEKIRYNASMFDLFSTLLDSIFPPKPRTLELETLASNDTLRKLKPAIDTPQPFIRALFHYKDPLVRALIWEIKYTGNPKLVKAVGALLHEEILAYFEDRGDFAAGSWLIIPIPASRAHLKQKGFNQTEELVKAIIHRDKGASLRHENTLFKVRETEAQAKVNRNKRLENLIDCYAVLDTKSVRGKSVIVIDDVTTTGSTFVEARRALKLAGAKRVIALSVAH